MTMGRAPIRSVSGPAMLRGISDPMPCGAISRPAARALLPLDILVEQGDQQQRPVYRQAREELHRGGGRVRVDAQQPDVDERIALPAQRVDHERRREHQAGRERDPRPHRGETRCARQVGPEIEHGLMSEATDLPPELTEVSPRGDTSDEFLAGIVDEVFLPLVSPGGTR